VLPTVIDGCDVGAAERVQKGSDDCRAVITAPPLVEGTVFGTPMSFSLLSPQPTTLITAAAAAAAGVGLPMCKTVVEDTWNKIFIGGLPCHYTDEQVRQLH
jgi:hypothetical protein